MLINLINAMKLEGITQSQLADLLDVRQATISDKITGKAKFYFEEALRIKTVFFPKYEIEYLFAKEGTIVAVSEKEVL